MFINDRFVVLLMYNSSTSYELFNVTFGTCVISKFTTFLRALQLVIDTICSWFAPSNSKVSNDDASFNVKFVSAPGTFRLLRFRIELGNCKSVILVFIALISRINGEKFSRSEPAKLGQSLISSLVK